MAEIQAGRRIIRFGAFEADMQTGELRKNGLKLKLSGHPFQVLAILLERPGEVVTRKEFQNRLWPDTFVDFEDNLNTAVNKIREALGDSAEHPRFVETLPRRGYRFIGTIEPTEQPVEPVEPVKPKARGSRRLWLIVGAIGVFAVVAMAILYLRRPLPPPHVTAYTQITHDARPIFSIAGTDGSRLYFNRYESSPQSIAQVAISGGGVVQVPVALPFPVIKDVSPDGSALLVSSHNEGRGSLWNVEMPAGSLRRLLTTGVAAAAWSPDGKNVAYSLGNGDLDLIRSDGNGARKLASLGAYLNGISWSPDGSRIRFSTDNKLWEVSSDGSGLHQLLPGWRPPSSQCCGRWTVDGKFFVFQSRDGIFKYSAPLLASQLRVLDERRGLFRRPEPVQLTSGPIRWNSPIPSKDGTKIFAHGVIERGELVRYDAKSGQFQPWLGGISAEFVTFSSDGQSVAYVTFPEGILWRANRDGSHPVQLTDASLYPLNPHWSPDGSQILFCSYNSKGLKAYVTPSQGGTPQLLIPEGREGQSDPSWSPDGGKIVFSTLEEIGNFNSVLRIFDIASHQVKTVSGSEGMWSPRWSPNGRFIAGLHDGPTGGVKIFDFETRRWSLVQQKGECNFPTWSSDSRFIYCILLDQDQGDVVRVGVSNGNAERVVGLKEFRFTGAFTLWMGLDPTDTPMLLRDVGTDDIYALTLEQK
jgi:Tol biopolymer transport system component/DNA-binding winged helix-turn-helix (wHTH) protein